MARVGLRWTIGDVSDAGFHALRLAIWGARKAFGEGTALAVCVNTVPVEIARRRTGELPPGVTWHEVTGGLPTFLKRHLDPSMAEGVAWKFAPLRLFPDRHEVSTDNDVVLWSMPRAVRRWLEADDGLCVIAEDVRAAFGQFAADCGDEGRNAGIRGMPPGFDLRAALQSVLKGRDVVLTSELDEQGLQIAALSVPGAPHVVSLEDVTICSPFPPHLPSLGACGAHFCGLNARDLGWELDGRRASDIVRAFWVRHLPELQAKVRAGSEVPC